MSKTAPVSPLFTLHSFSLFLSPAQGAFDGLIPAVQAFFPLFAGNAREKVRSMAQFLRTSSRSFQYPTARPARYAAPMAVVSTHLGRCTGASMISDWVCISENGVSAMDHPLCHPERAKRVEGSSHRFDRSARQNAWILRLALLAQDDNGCINCQLSTINCQLL